MLGSPNGMPFPLSERLAVETEADERTRIFEQAWATGGLQFRSSFFDLMTDENANAFASDFIKAKIREIVRDPKTAAVLADINHPYGTKRPPVDSFYFETFNLDHVDLGGFTLNPHRSDNAGWHSHPDADYLLRTLSFLRPALTP